MVDAALAMVRHGIRHVVVTRDGRLTRRGLRARPVRPAAHQPAPHRRAREERRDARRNWPGRPREVRALARALLAQGVGAEQLTQMTCALNDGIAQRVIEHHGAEARPARRMVLAGAGQRRAPGADARHRPGQRADLRRRQATPDAARARFLPFAQEVNAALDACGFPLCKGEIMARNPKWCLSLEEWGALFAGWIRNPQPEALLNAGIFFDFRALAAKRGWRATCARRCCARPPATRRSAARWWNRAAREAAARTAARFHDRRFQGVSRARWT